MGLIVNENCAIVIVQMWPLYSIALWLWVGISVLVMLLTEEPREKIGTRNKF